MSTYDFSTLCAALPCNSIKEKLKDTAEYILNKEGLCNLNVIKKKCFFPFLLLKNQKTHNLLSCQDIFPINVWSVDLACNNFISLKQVHICLLKKEKVILELP